LEGKNNLGLMGNLHEVYSEDDVIRKIPCRCGMKLRWAKEKILLLRRSSLRIKNCPGAYYK